MARIAVAGFLHETNTFAPIKTTWDDFLRAEDFPGLTEGAAILETVPPMHQFVSRGNANQSANHSH